jgi:hypothetical protein
MCGNSRLGLSALSATLFTNFDVLKVKRSRLVDALGGLCSMLNVSPQQARIYLVDRHLASELNASVCEATTSRENNYLHPNHSDFQQF